MFVKKLAVHACFIVTAFVQASVAWAAEAPPQPIASPEFSWLGYIQAIAAMVLVLFVIWGVVWLLRRSGRLAGLPRNSLPKGSLFVEGQLNLAPRKGLVVVRFLNKRLLLGVTEQQICMLTELELHEETPSFDSCLAEAAKKESQPADAD